MRFVRLWAVALTLASSQLADARQRDKPPLFAAQRLYNAGGVQILGGGARFIGPGKAYFQPALVNNYVAAFGDSRTANSAAFPPWSGSTFTVATDYSNGYAGWIFPLSGNLYLAETGWNYGVGAQTTAGIAGRLNSTTQYCNDASTIGYACFNGASATTSAALAPNPGSPLTITLTGVSGAPSAGDYITIANTTNFGCQIASYDSVALNVVVPANCIIASAASGAAVAFAHPATASAFAAYAPFNTTSAAGASITDVDTNKVNGGTYYGGAYSIVNDPAQVVFLLAGTNDGNRGALNAISDLQAIFNAFGPTAANKIVVVGDELARGLAEGYSRANANTLGAPEVWTVPSASPYTATVANAANYWDTQQVFYAPCGSTTTGTPANAYSCGTTASSATFSAGASDGVALTATASAPAQGQYAVSNGVYTFNSADAGKKIAIYYRWKTNNNPAGSTYLTTIHDWLNATSCGSWTDPISGTNYPGVSGAQCPGLYPWVHVASTWSAELDAAAVSGSNNYFNLPYTSIDGLHPSPYGGAVVANAMLQAANLTSAIPTSRPFTPATAQNYFFYGVSTTSTATQTSTCPATTKNDYLSSVYVGGTALTAIPQATAQSIFKTGSKLFFANATQSALNGLTVVCVDAANGLVQMSAASPVIMTGSTSNWAFVQNDNASPGSFIGDSISGGNIYSLQTNTASPLANTGTPSGSGIGATVVKGAPYGWTLAADSGTATALSQGVMGLSYGVEQNPFGDGNDDFVVQLQGYAGTGVQITLSQLIQSSIAATFSAGQSHRAICRVKVSAGPNGHLYGVESIAVKYYDQTTGTFSPPGLASNIATLWAARQGGSSVEFSDASIASGAPGVTSTSLGNVLTLDELTPAAAVEGSGTVTSQISFYVTYAAGDPVSATIRLQSCRAMQVSQ
jgi:lysophospholipase L1-like esterase